MNTEILIAYTLVAFFYITSPGPAILLAIVNGIRAGMRTVVMSSLGNMVGLAVLSLASILGLGLLLQTSAFLFMVVKVTGAVYFIYLGVKFWRSRNSLVIDTSSSSDDNQITGSQIPSNKIKVEQAKKTRTTWSYFIEAFWVAATNPKPILFFTAIFPQFLDTTQQTTPQFLLMTAIFLSISFLSLCTYGYLSVKSKHWLENDTRMKWFHRITGGLFIGLGIGLLQLKPTTT